MKVQNSLDVSYSVDVAVEKLLFVECQSAESRSWWEEMTWKEIYQSLLPEEIQYLENKFS